MLDNMNFYNFMHKQILVVIGIFLLTGLGYLYIGWIYSSFLSELLWFCLIIASSSWGYYLYRSYSDTFMSIKQKDAWLKHLQYFLYIYFSFWTIMFLIYTSRDNVDLHYIAIATQLGVAVVSSAILVSQRKLAIVTLVSLMLPLFIYFIVLNEFYSYLLAVFTVVLSGVLLYASHNTFNYLLKSRYQAYHDYLTTLGNRRYFIEALGNAIKLQKVNQKYSYILLIDLDHFKTINDTLGHDIGDMLLYSVAKRMDLLSRQYHNSISRLGGDEFCILSSSYKDKELCLKNAVDFAHTLLAIIKESYVIDSHHLYISASIGVSIIDNPKMQASTFIKEADIAMYEAKALGRDGVMIFNDDLSVRVERKLEIERLLHFALEKNEISLRYQPQFNTYNKIIGCEVLVRWHSQELGDVGPEEFIPISEQTGLILELGYFILEESFKTLQAWSEKGIELQQLSINISMRQLFHGAFVQEVQKLVKLYLDKKLCSKLIFEMTETSAAENLPQLIETMEILRMLGIRFSMDDFGTGYSSLSYLRQIPLDELKIDQSFISELVDEQGQKMVHLILYIAKNLNLTIVAEGVENSFQKDFLIEHKCDILQGYYFSKPIKKDNFEAFFYKYKMDQGLDTKQYHEDSIKSL